MFLGDGPLRPALHGRPGIRLVGPVPHDLVASWMAASDVVCQPSLAEPFGLVTLEGMACGRTVVATAVGGPREFVTDAGGVIVDPYDEDALRGALSETAGFPRPNVAARAAAEDHDIKRQAERVEALLARACRDRRA